MSTLMDATQLLENYIVFYQVQFIPTFSPENPLTTLAAIKL